MIRQSYPDGSWIELAWGDFWGPIILPKPHNDVTHPWVQTDSEEWHEADEELDGPRIRELMAAAETADEAFGAITGRDEHA